ncbi:MAG: SPOR domain-containing protein [Nitrosomonadales bacterium]|nr:SPOR domain-containing protein [Nitrosomonadales bacterium]
MAKQITDDEDRLKRQARRRLIGAVALTTVVVVVVPMLLDNEPKPTGQDIELRIPDKDRVGEFTPKLAPMTASEPLPVSAVATPPVVATPVVVHPTIVAPQVESNKPAVVPAPPKPVAAPPVAKLDTPPVKSVVQPEKPSEKPAAKPADKPVAKPADKAIEQPAAKAAEKPVDKAVVKDDAKPASGAKHDAPAAAFVVQVGAFSKAETAHSLQKKLVKQNFKAYTEKAGDKLRVRTGPYVTREAANKARHKLEALGLHPAVVDLAQ